MRDVKFGKDQTRGAPKSVMLWGTFHGNAEAMQTAIDSGDLVESVVDGDSFCGFRELKAGRTKENEHSQKMNSGAAQVSKDTYNQLGDVTGAMSWQFAQKQARGNSSGASSSAGPGALALAQPHLIPGAEEAIMEAVAATDKLLSTGMKLVGKMDPSSRYFQDLKVAINKLTESKSRADFIVTWKTMPGTNAIPNRLDLDNLLVNLAEGVSQLNTCTEICNG